MQRFHRTLLMAATVLTFTAFAAGASERPTVVATTPWTAAFAHAAGVEDVHVLAPYEMQHPPEYELRASDVVRAQQAEYLVFGGYEAMMGRLRAAIGGTSPELIQIRTDHAIATIESSVMAIAERTGTVEAARANIAELTAFIAEWKAELKSSRIHSVPVVVHAHQRAILRELGIETVGVFGPGPLSPRQIDELTRSGAAVVVDVWHNESAAPLRETLPDAVFVSLINFPGRDGTVTLLDVLRHKRATLAAAVARLE